MTLESALRNRGCCREDGGTGLKVTRRGGGGRTTRGGMPDDEPDGRQNPDTSKSARRLRGAKHRVNRRELDRCPAKFRPGGQSHKPDHGHLR